MTWIGDSSFATIHVSEVLQFRHEKSVVCKYSIVCDLENEYKLFAWYKYLVMISCIFLLPLYCCCMQGIHIIATVWAHVAIR